MYIATVNDDSLKRGLKISAALHALAFAFLIFGLPRLVPPLPEHHEPVPFEIVTLAELTNTRVKEEPEQPKPPAPPPKPTPPQPAPAPPQTTPIPPAPPKPAEVKPLENAEALKPKAIEKPKPVEKPQPDLMASVLKNVSKLKPAEQEVKAPDVKTEVKTTPQPVASPAPALSTRLTISEEDLLRRQIETCWSPPIGARNAQSLVVEVVIDVNADRTVANTDIVDKARYNTDSFFRAAADAAIRAVRNPRCSPLALPADKYEQWKRIDFTFDPRDML